MKISNPPLKTPFVDRHGSLTSPWINWFREIADTRMREVVDTSNPPANPSMKAGEAIILKATGVGKTYLVYFDGSQYYYWDKDAAGSGGTTDHSELSNLGYSESGHTGFAPETHGHQITDVSGLASSLSEMNTAISGKQEALGFTPENVANKGQNNGYAPLGNDGKVPDAYLPDIPTGEVRGTYLYSSTSPAETGTSKRFYAERSGTIEWVQAFVVDGDGTSMAEVDVLLNGSSIFSPGNLPYVSVGQYQSSRIVPTVTGFQDGDYFQVNIISTGDTAGAIRVYIRFLS